MALNNVGKDLVRLRRRIAAGKRAMLKTEIKAEDLETAIQAAMDRQRLKRPQAS